MEGDWLTYGEAAERLGSTAEAVRYRAILGQMAEDARQRRACARAAPRRTAEPRAHPERTPSARGCGLGGLHALQAHNETLKGDIEALRAQLADEKARTAAAETRLIDAAAVLEAERERTGKAIAAFSALAERLDALAEERRRPWWRRLVSG